jgi:cytoskeleton protein RodZ
MKSFGEQLKKERENRKKSLADIAKATKISKIVLTAIEEEQYESLPPLSYIKGFLRIYAGA